MSSKSLNRNPYDKLDKEINFGSPYSDYAYDTIEGILKERKKKKIEI